SISFAALLVNVTARIECGLAWPVAISHAMRVVSTRVLPLPAPARIRADACGSVTAASCSGLRLESRVKEFAARTGVGPPEPFVVPFRAKVSWEARRADRNSWPVCEL